ncbi:MAG: aminotransferase class V-fold PLP-dependent enzyme [Deltaproteobacteria bacterium]|nr:aminotransferase class V-fold PLP-dependent enzyme [Deltaproteobacteria bacterium]
MIYLDNAATSFPKPDAVYKSVDNILRNVGGNPGRASHRMALEASRVVFNAREALAKVIGCPDSSRVVFTKNATEAINIALKGFGLKPGDHVITTSFEHNSVYKTVSRLEEEGIAVTRLGPTLEGFVDASAARRAITKKTRLVCVTHASNVFGTLLPIRDIGEMLKAKGIPFMVDGAQTVGACPVDVGDNIDILAGTGHKALFGPQGTGFLYVREGIELSPLINGGTGDLDNVLEMPERLESGTMNTPGLGGLTAGIEFVMDTGIPKIHAHEKALMETVISGLEAVSKCRIIGTTRPDRRASLCAFTIEGLKTADIGRRLDEEFGIMIRTGAHCAPYAHREAGTYPDGAARVSPGYFNTPEHIAQFLRAIRIIAKK